MARSKKQLTDEELMERWATISDLATLYSMSTASVRRRAKSGEWPSHSVDDKTIRFSPTDQRNIRDMWKTNQSTLQEKKMEALQMERIKKLLSDGR